MLSMKVNVSIQWNCLCESESKQLCSNNEDVWLQLCIKVFVWKYRCKIASKLKLRWSWEVVGCMITTTPCLHQSSFTYQQKYLSESKSTLVNKVHLPKYFLLRILIIIPHICHMHHIQCHSQNFQPGVKKILNECQKC